MGPEFVDSMMKGKTSYEGEIFKIGVMVWAKVESHPWWPAMILNEAFGSPSVLDSKIEGHSLVAFFGDGTYNWFDPAELISFDSHFIAKSKKKKVPGFTKAVEEAVTEFSRRAALGLACCCQNSSKFHCTGVEGFLKVDMNGYEPGGLYSVEQIKMAREDFDPYQTRSFVLQLATNQGLDSQGFLDCMKNAARVLAYRRAVFSETDETYAHAFGEEPMPRLFGDSSSMAALYRTDNLMAQGIWKKKQATNNHQANGSVKKVTGKSVLALAESTENRKAIKVDAKNGTGMEEANLRMKHLKASLREPGSLPSRGICLGTNDEVSKTVGGKEAIMKVRSTESPESTHPLTTTIKANATDQPSKKRLRPASPVQATKKHDTPNHQDKKSVKKATEKCVLALEERAGKQKALDIEDEDEEKMKEADSITKHTPTSADEPTVLLMKFPHQSSMPSVTELKLRFSHFPSLDRSSVCVFWKSSTCRVVFTDKKDAQEAYDYAASGALFGTKVTYSLQDLKASRKPNVEKVIGNFNGTTSSPSTNVHVRSENSQQAMDNQTYQATTTGNVDISADFLNLIEKCSKIVSDVKNAFGYLPVL